MKCIVTGASGFIGSHLVKRLKSDGHEILTIYHKTDNLDIYEAFEDFRPDIVYHLASLFISEHYKWDFEALIDGNIKFGTLILEAMKESGCKHIVNTSTSWTHFNEEEYNPVNLYAATKKAFEDIARYYVEAHNFAVTTLELYDTYGPGDERQKLIPSIMKAALNYNEIELTDGNQIFNFTYIDDVIRAFILAQESQYPMSNFSVYSGDDKSLREIVELIEVVSGRKIKAKYGTREYRKREIMRPKCYLFGIPRWKQETYLQFGLKKTWESLRV